MWRLLYKEYKPDTATRKVGLLERVIDDQPAPGVNFTDWLDLVGECEHARGRMIDDDTKGALMLKRSPKKDHLAREPTVSQRRKQVPFDAVGVVVRGVPPLCTFSRQSDF